MDTNLKSPPQMSNLQHSNSRSGDDLNAAQTLNSPISKFRHYVKDLHEIEYGDFKRKLSLYILRLEQGLPKSDAQTNSQSRRIISAMREIAIYNPQADIDTVREEILDLANQL